MRKELKFVIISAGILFCLSSCCEKVVPINPDIIPKKEVIEISHFFEANNRIVTDSVLRKQVTKLEELLVKVANKETISSDYVNQLVEQNDSLKASLLRAVREAKIIKALKEVTYKISDLEGWRVGPRGPLPTPCDTGKCHELLRKEVLVIWPPDIAINGISLEQNGTILAQTGPIRNNGLVGINYATLKFTNDSEGPATLSVNYEIDGVNSSLQSNVIVK